MSCSVALPATIAFIYWTRFPIPTCWKSCGGHIWCSLIPAAFRKKSRPSGNPSSCCAIARTSRSGACADRRVGWHRCHRHSRPDLGLAQRRRALRATHLGRKSIRRRTCRPRIAEVIDTALRHPHLRRGPRRLTVDRSVPHWIGSLMPHSAACPRGPFSCSLNILTGVTIGVARYW